MWTTACYKPLAIPLPSSIYSQFTFLLAFSVSLYPTPDTILADVRKTTTDANVEKVMKTSTNSNASDALSISDDSWYRKGSNGQLYFSGEWQGGQEQPEECC
jgi:hypothetical protein